MARDVFFAPVFFIIFRETLETSIVVGILLSFLQQTLAEPTPVLYKKLVRQVWVGTGAGLSVCLVVGAGIIGAFYSLRKRNLWSKSEDLYEGIFSLIASVIITIMGAWILRINKMKENWCAKLEADDAEGIAGYSRRYAMFILPFVTVLREGLEAVLFVGGVGLAEPASAFPLPVITALAAGILVGYIVYRGGITVGVKLFLLASTALLYLVAAGLISKAAWSFDMYQYSKLVGGDVAETGVGPGSYNIHRTVWHINCCSPQFNGGSGWGVFYSLFGWQNTATYSSVLTYNLYWLVVATGFIVMAFREKHGRYPFLKAKASTGVSSPAQGILEGEKGVGEKVTEVKGI